MNAMGAHLGTMKAPVQRQKALALTYHRLMLMMLVFAGVTSLIVLRLIYLQIFTDRATATAGNPLLPARGDITDRNGVSLARTIDAWSIAVHPNKLVGEPAQLAVKLNELMPERSIGEYLAILRSGKSFVYLSRRAVPELVSAVNALGEPGIEFSREPERLYPQTALAAHILGWTDFDGRGVAGLEKVLDKNLMDPSLRGSATTLSIDTRVQAAMEAELGAAMTKHSAEGGTGIVLDVKTGELLALASFPTFNPNAAGKFEANSQYNRATMGVYELGSTFKPLTVATALDAGTIRSLSRRFDAGSADSASLTTRARTAPSPCPKCWFIPRTSAPPASPTSLASSGCRHRSASSASTLRPTSSCARRASRSGPPSGAARPCSPAPTAMASRSRRCTSPAPMPRSSMGACGARQP
jgi:cell division protein FtsI (penicillin-binding protein 3)